MPPLSSPMPAKLLQQVDARLAAARAWPRVPTLADHQARLRSAGQRPLTRDEAAQLYPADEVERAFGPVAPAGTGPAGQGAGTRVEQNGAVLFVLPWQADDAQVQAAIIGWNAAHAAVEGRVSGAIDYLAERQRSDAFL